MVAIILKKEINKSMTYCTTLMLPYDFDNPMLRQIQQEIKKLATKHNGQFTKESDEWNELRLTFLFKSRIFLVNFLVEANYEYADALIVNVWKEEKAA
jgi:hypothetical protein